MNTCAVRLVFAVVSGTLSGQATWYTLSEAPVNVRRKQMYGVIVAFLSMLIRLAGAKPDLGPVFPPPFTGRRRISFALQGIMPFLFLRFMPFSLLRSSEERRWEEQEWQDQEGRYKRLARAWKGRGASGRLRLLRSLGTARERHRQPRSPAALLLLSVMNGTASALRTWQSLAKGAAVLRDPAALL